MEPTDAELVVCARSGEASCLAVLLERHRARMYAVAVAVAVLGPGHETEDAVHDAVLVALSRLDTLRDPDAAGPWLAGITRNICRQRFRRVVGTRDHVMPGALVSDAFDPGAVLEAHALRDWVWSALDGLSEPLRHAVVLRYFSQSNSYEAIAGTLGVPVGTVRSRLNQAKKVLDGSIRDLASRTHGDHGRVVRDRTALFVGIFGEYNRGLRCSLLRSTLTDEAELRGAGGGDIRGRDRVASDIETDIDAGIRLQVLDLIAGSDITIVEGAFQNPVEDPGHCPALTTQVFLHRGEQISSVRVHYRDAAPDDEHHLLSLA